MRQEAVKRGLDHDKWFNNVEVVTAEKIGIEQSLPADQVPACGMGISCMMDIMPFMDVLKKVFAGSGECAERGCELLGLAIPGRTLVFFIAMTVTAFALIRQE